MSHTLADNVIVKWEDYREWTDENTGENWYAWEIRVCVVPKKYEDIVRTMTPDLNRSFLVLEDLPDGAQMFPYRTFRYSEKIL